MPDQANKLLTRIARLATELRRWQEVAGAADFARLDAVQEARQWRGRAERAEAELAAYKAATDFCEKCQPNGGFVSCCQRCALIAANRAISRIDYALGEPNEMEVSLYDWDCDQERVVRRVKRTVQNLKRLSGEGEDA